MIQWLVEWPIAENGTQDVRFTLKSQKCLTCLDVKIALIVSFSYNRVILWATSSIIFCFLSFSFLLRKFNPRPSMPPDLLHSLYLLLWLCFFSRISIRLGNIFFVLYWACELERWEWMSMLITSSSLESAKKFPSFLRGAIIEWFVFWSTTWDNFIQNSWIRISTFLESHFICSS
jgi:hypothetical protein